MSPDGTPASSKRDGTKKQQQQPSHTKYVALLSLLIAMIAFQRGTFASGKYQVVLEEQIVSSTYCNAKARKDSQDDERHTEGLSIVGAFNHAADLQMDEASNVEASLDYIKGWYDSIQKFPGIRGVVLTTMYDQEFITTHSKSSIQFHVVNQTSPSFLRGQNKSVHDQRFYIFRDYLRNARATDADYVLFNNAQDVTFLRNPFKFMRTMDKLVGYHHIYMQAEFEASEELQKEQSDLWRSCLNETFGLRRHLTTGLIGGHRDVIVTFLEDIVAGLDGVIDKEKICGQSVIQQLARVKHAERIISGYPFEANQTANDTVAYIAAARNQY